MELFKNAHEALFFAHRFSSQQYAQSPMAKMMERGPGGGPIGQGKGLVSLDGAATAGMILGRVERLSELHRACIVARFAERTDECPCCNGQRMSDDYKAALLQLAQWARPLIRDEVDSQRMRFGVVQAFYDRKSSITQLAKSIGMPARTVLDQKKKIWEQLGQLDKAALTAADDVLNGLYSDGDN
jgi:hypothetical protein